MQENLGGSSPRDMFFPSSKPSSLPDSKVLQILPLGPAVPHQNNVMGHDAEIQGRSQVWPGLDLPFHGTLQQSLLEVLHCILQHRGKTERCFLVETQAGAEDWQVSHKVQNNLLGTS